MVVLAKTIVNLRKTTVTIISLVAMASVMNYAGMILVIATALAGATGAYYPFFAPLIGAIGTFVTGSDTSSNILFGKLQANVAGQLHYADPNWLVAANTTGATVARSSLRRALPLRQLPATCRARMEIFSAPHCLMLSDTSS